MKSIGNCVDTSINICLFQGYCSHLPRKWITYSVHWITELGQRFTRYYATTRMLDSQVCYFFYQEGWGWGSDCEPKMLQFYLQGVKKWFSKMFCMSLIFAGFTWYTITSSQVNYLTCPRRFTLSFLVFLPYSRRCVIFPIRMGFNTFLEWTYQLQDEENEYLSFRY